MMLHRITNFVTRAESRKQGREDTSNNATWCIVMLPDGTASISSGGIPAQQILSSHAGVYLTSAANGELVHPGQLLQGGATYYLHQSLPSPTPVPTVPGHRRRRSANLQCWNDVAKPSNDLTPRGRRSSLSVPGSRHASPMPTNPSALSGLPAVPSAPSCIPARRLLLRRNSLSLLRTSGKAHVSSSDPHTPINPFTPFNLASPSNSSSPSNPFTRFNLSSPSNSSGPSDPFTTSSAPPLSEGSGEMPGIMLRRNSSEPSTSTSTSRGKPSVARTASSSSTTSGISGSLLIPEEGSFLVPQEGSFLLPQEGSLGSPYDSVAPMPGSKVVAHRAVRQVSHHQVLPQLQRREPGSSQELFSYSGLLAGDCLPSNPTVVDGSVSWTR